MKLRKRFIGAFVIALALLAIRQAGAATLTGRVLAQSDTITCRNGDTAAADKHGHLCAATAELFAELVRDSSEPCEAVVSSVMNQRMQYYAVRCIVSNELHILVSTNGLHFERIQ